MDNERDRLRAGARWVSMATAGSVATHVFETIVLARLLSPHEFGLIAMAAVVVGVLRSVGDLGTGTALVHYQETDQARLATIYWLNVGAGLTLTVVLAALSPVASWFYHEPRLVRLMAAVCPSLVLLSLGNPYYGILQKNLRFGALASADFFAALAGVASAVVVALRYRSAMAFAASLVVTALTRTMLLVLPGRRLFRPRLAIDLGQAMHYLRFGSFQIGERVVNYFSANVDYIVVGRYLGANALGIYRIAYELATIPLRLVNPAFTTLAFPLFSRRQNDDAQLRDGYCRIIRMVALVAFPVILGITATAPDLIDVVFGPVWHPASTVLLILSIMGIAKTLGNTGGTVVLAKGMVQISFKWNCIVAAGNALAFTVAVNHGLTVLAGAYSVLSVIFFFVSYRDTFVRSIGLPLADYLGAALPPLAIASGMAGLVYAAGAAAAALPINQPVRLAMLAALGTIIYCSLVALFDRKSFSYLLDTVYTRKAAR